MITLGAPLIALDEADSANLVLKRLAAEGTPIGTVVTARAQTAGYGQRGRSWSSEAGLGLYMSVLLPLPEQPTHLPFIVGLGCLAGLASWAPETRLKWVNDLVLSRRKLGGMLIEVVRGAAVAGVGINLCTPEVADAIGLDALGAPPTADSLRDAVLAGIEDRLARHDRDGFETTRADWTAASVTIGTSVRVLAEPPVAGRAEGLGPHGELLVRTGDGSLATVVSGTVRTAEGAYC